MRKEVGLTQVQMSEALNVSQQVVQSWEAGRRRIQIPILPAVAKILSVHLEGFLGEEAENTPRKRGPSDDLALQFEAVSGVPEEERRIIKALLDGMILKYQAKQITERG
ncbi:helix-turn-helix domain-containing protein [Lonsdalea iberica]|uniref:helix-turn-helix domain-containing protein n=1 Tax=Lonsdalea iberica TaxID=1082703 RepID=UPI0034A0C46B